jgi:hypothetical protein
MRLATAGRNFSILRPAFARRYGGTQTLSQFRASDLLAASGLNGSSGKTSTPPNANLKITA